MLITSYQDLKRKEFSEVKNSSDFLLKNFKKVASSETKLNEFQQMEYAYYLTFGLALKGLPLSSSEILAKIKYQETNLTVSQILGEALELQHAAEASSSHLSLLLLIQEIFRIINEEKSLSNEQKLKYGEMVRAQLSEDELILIVAFSFTYTGKNFEQFGKLNSNYYLRLITKYSIIKNLAVNLFGKGVLQKLFPEVQFEWVANEKELSNIKLTEL